MLSPRQAATLSTITRPKSGLFTLPNLRGLRLRGRDGRCRAPTHDAGGRPRMGADRMSGLRRAARPHRDAAAPVRRAARVDLGRGVRACDRRHEHAAGARVHRARDLVRLAPARPGRCASGRRLLHPARARGDHRPGRGVPRLLAAGLAAWGGRRSGRGGGGRGGVGGREARAAGMAAGHGLAAAAGAPLRAGRRRRRGACGAVAGARADRLRARGAGLRGGLRARRARCRLAAGSLPPPAPPAGSARSAGRPSRSVAWRSAAAS